jgi:hypothetical protein
MERAEIPFIKIMIKSFCSELVLPFTFSRKELSACLLHQPALRHCRGEKIHPIALTKYLDLELHLKMPPELRSEHRASPMWVVILVNDSLCSLQVLVFIKIFSGYLNHRF